MERSRLLLDLMPAVAWTTDGELRFTSSLGGGLRCLGLADDEVVGMSVADYLGADPAAAPVLDAHLRALGGQRASFTLEWQGHVFDAEVAPLGGGSACVGTFGVAIEASRRARAEGDLATAEAGLQLLVQQLPARIHTTDRELRVTSVRGTSLTGRGRPDDAVGRTVQELLGLEDPEAEPLSSHDACLAGASRVYTTERDGRVFETRLEPLRDERGEIVGCLGLTLDATERRRRQQAAEQLAAIVESSSDAIFGMTLEGTITSWNAAAERIYGYSSAEAVGRPIAIVVPEERTSELRDEIARLRAGERIEPFDTVRRRKDDTRVEVSLALSPVRDEGGAIVGASVVARDLGPARRLEAELRQSQKLEAVGRLAGGIAHDFNNLLTALRMYAELAVTHLDAGRVEGAREELDGIRATIERAAAIVRQLLALGRRQFLNPVRGDLNELVEGARPLLGRLLGAGLELDVRLERGLPPVEVDRAQLEQVLLNLATNARDAMPGGGRLTIETGRASDGVFLAVADTGHGIDDETATRIFEPFFTTKPEGAGTGLGLATVYGIVAQSGGRIEVDSAPGRGATFRIVLPVREPAVAL